MHSFCHPVCNISRSHVHMYIWDQLSSNSLTLLKLHMFVAEIFQFSKEAYIPKFGMECYRAGISRFGISFIYPWPYIYWEKPLNTTNTKLLCMHLCGRVTDTQVPLWSEWSDCSNKYLYFTINLLFFFVFVFFLFLIHSQLKVKFMAKKKKMEINIYCKLRKHTTTAIPCSGLEILRKKKRSVKQWNVWCLFYLFIFYFFCILIRSLCISQNFSHDHYCPHSPSSSLTCKLNWQSTIPLTLMYSIRTLAQRFDSFVSY